MRKTMAVIALAMVAALALCLVGCGNATSPENDYIGTWKGENSSNNYFDTLTYTIEQNGIARADFSSDDPSATIKGTYASTWEYVNDKVKIDTNLTIMNYTDYLVISDDKQSLKGEISSCTFYKQ